MLDMVFPNEDGGPWRMLVAVGPEGKWEEPYELDIFEWMGFERVSLGSRALRNDLAVVSLLAIANESCALDSAPS
jgi:16S rRNA U1498 N3-methylase RsmE